MSNALTTTSRVKDRLKLTTTEFDTLIANLIIGVTARMETMCGRLFTLGTYTHELHDGSDFYGTIRTMLITKNAPVASVATIEYKAGTNTTPNWTEIDNDYYDVDLDAGIIHLSTALPYGKRNIRITYTAGWDGFAFGLGSYWNFNVTPTGTVNGSNGTFTLPEDADELIVYADGVRLTTANVTFTAGTDSFVIAAAAVPFSSIAVDYKETVGSATGDAVLPAELVDVCERAVAYLFKKRDMEGRTTESFQESSVTWREDIFTKEMLATIRNYRRGYNP
jgi:hypothetical protein